MASYYSSWVQADNPDIKLRMRLDTSYTQNTSKNESTVTVKQYIESANYVDYIGNGSSSGWTENHKMTISGSSWTSSGTKYYAKNTTTSIQSHSKTISHNANGEASFSISGSCTAYVLHDAGYFVNKNISIGTKYISLPKINRISTIKAASSVEFGKSITFNITRNGSTSTVHTLTYEINGTKGEIGTKIGTSKAWTVPTSLIKKVPTASAKMTVTCTTYDGSTKLGTSTCSFTCTVPASYKPTCTFRKEIYELEYILTTDGTYQANKEYYIYNSSTGLYELFTNYNVGDSITGDVYVKNYYLTGDSSYQNGKNYYKKENNIYTLLIKGTDYNIGDLIASLSPVNEKDWRLFIQNISKLQGTLYGEGIEGSTIKSYEIKVNGQTLTTQNFLTSTLTTPGINTITGTVVDSRNHPSEMTTETFYVTPYNVPTLDAPKCSIERCTSLGVLNEEGEYGKATISFTVFSLNDLNSFKLKIYRKDDETIYKEVSNSTYSTVTGTYQDNKNYYKKENGEYILLILGKDYEIGEAISGTIYQKNIVINFDTSPYVFNSYFSNLGQNNSYTFVFRIEDEFSSFQTEKTISPIFVTMSLKSGGHGVSFGRAAKEENVLANYMDTKLYAKTWVNDMSIGGFKTMKIRDGSWVIYEEN